MKSCIYEGSVMHRRYEPVPHQFRYRLFMMYLDLAELPKVFAPYRLWSVERFNLASFRRRDHAGDHGLPLDEAIRDRVEDQTGRRPGGPVRILTHLRYFGYIFNPVSFYYCYDAADNDVETIITEIHNTPWLEEHLYVLDKTRNEHPQPQWRRFRFQKDFHVSPFMDMDIDYDWRFRIPGPRLNVHMVNTVRGARIFDASLALERREISGKMLSRVLVHYPLMTAKVTAMIYWNALRLYRKGVPVYDHPAKREQEKLS
jgi:DUF1365 family protein